ncbi:MAG: type II toxin-antitoxin system VapC family toxin [Leptolyngbyaceae cyanobacterium]
MSYLIDTNILLRSTQKNHPLREVAVQAVKTLFYQGKPLCVTSQNLIEFWVVATRLINVNGLGLSGTEALNELEQIQDTFTLLPDVKTIFPIWKNLTVSHQVMGKPAHDVRLVAAMTAYGLTHLLTFNIDDFKRFSSITAIPPRAVSGVK